MSYKNIQSDSFIPKQEIPRDIESNQIFSYELFEYRLNHQESEITSLKEDINNKFDRLNSSILRVEQNLDSKCDKIDSKCEKLDDKIISNYNKIENRLYGILIAVVAFVVVDILVRKGNSIIQFFSSNP